MKLSIKKYFSKILTRNFDHYEGFRQSYQMIGPFTAIKSICNQTKDFFQLKFMKTEENFYRIISMTESSLSLIIKYPLIILNLGITD